MNTPNEAVLAAFLRRAFYVTVYDSERRVTTMQHEQLSEAELDGWLKTLGITSLCQWDVLVFLYRHQTSLVGANMIAHLLGYASDPVVAALDVLAFLGLVERSRVSQVARIYQFTEPSDPQRHDAWTALLPLASLRAGRVHLARHLRGNDQTAQAERQEIQQLLSGARRSVEASRHGLHETWHSLAEARESVEASRRQMQSQRGGPTTWLKVI
jgi:DNA-binding MarR family transcriptional regulator